jgi:hypothetical protein
MPVATLVSLATAASLSTAIITQNQVSLRAAPRDSAKQQTLMWKGEVVEVRGTRMDYLQVYDYKRERAGYIRADQVHITQFSAAEAPELLSVVRFVHDTPGAETLGIGFAAAYIKAAPAEAINGANGAEVLEALGTFADRLASRASSSTSVSKTAEATLSAQLDIASQYGMKFKTYEMIDHIQMCYDGEVYRRVLAMKSTPEQAARAALALTRPDCVDPSLQPLERSQMEVWQADVLERVETKDLPGYLKNRIQMRRASVLSNMAYLRTRMNSAPESLKLSGINTDAGILGQRAIDAFTSVTKNDLPDEDLPVYNDTAIRVNAGRWVTLPAPSANKEVQGLSIVSSPGQPGETCVALVDARHDAKSPLAKRCTYGIVWSSSVSVNREQNALALAVQPMEAWRETWVFRKTKNNWSISVLPPATTNPELGYAEFAGWVPGGKQMLVAREARGEGKYKHNFEVINLDSLATERQSPDPTALGPFQRWQDPIWKSHTLSIR